MKNFIFILLAFLISFTAPAQVEQKGTNFGTSVGMTKMTDSRGWLNAGGDFEFVVKAEDKSPDVYGTLALTVGLQGYLPFYFTPGVGFALRADQGVDIVPFGKISTGIWITEWVAFDASYRALFGDHIFSFGVKFNPTMFNPGSGCGY